MSYPPRLTNDEHQSANGTSTGRSTRTRIGIGFALFFLLFALIALSSSGKISRPVVAKTKANAVSQIINGVGVTPAEITLPARGGVQFTAKVMGIEDQRVSWSVNGSVGGNASIGTIPANGLYTAPDLSPDAPPAQFIIRATSLADASMFGEATVTVTGRGSQFRSPSVSVRHGNAPDTNTISTFNTDAVSVMYGASSSDTFSTYLSNAISVQYGAPSTNSLATYLSNAISVRYGTPSSSNPFPTYFSNAISVQYGTPAANPFSTYFLNAVSVSYGNPPDICTPPPSGMVAWYPAEGNANDIQGTNNGTLQNGATFAAGKVGQAFSFDGVDDAVGTSPTALNDAFTALTVDAWVYPLSHGTSTSSAGYGLAIISKTETDGFALRIKNGLIQADLRLSSGNVLQAFDSPLPVNEWSYAAITYDGASVKVFLNGVFVGSVAATGTIKNSLNTNTCLMVGNEPTAPCAVQTQAFGFNGRIDEADIFNRALSQTEIQAIYNAGSAGKCPPGNLASLTLNPTTLTGGQTSTGTVTLVNPAPLNGATVNLSSGDTNVATVPASITIPQGETVGTFTVSTTSRLTDTAVNITASRSGETRVASLIVLAVGTDLTIEQFQATPPPPVEAGTTVQLSAQVRNLTTLAATCSVRFYRDSVATGNLIGAQTGIAVPANGQSSATATWNTQTAPGTFNLIAQIENVTPAESNTGNNTATLNRCSDKV